jgi:hypothetical protein
VGCCAQLSVCRFGSCLIRKADFGTPKMENTLLWDKTKISLRGIPCHPKDHARVRYGLVLTNYDMIRAKPSSFDLKVMQPRTWSVIFVTGLSGKLLFIKV